MDAEDVEVKVTWEEGDLDCGRVVSASNKTERYVLGYRYDRGGNMNKFFVLASLRDGQVSDLGSTPTAAIAALNERQLLPAEVLEPKLARSEDVLRRT